MENYSGDVYEPDEEMLITLEMEDGTEEECIVLEIFEVNGRDYIALLPSAEAEKEDANVYFYGSRVGSMGSFRYDLTQGGFLNKYCGQNPKSMSCPSFTARLDLGDLTRSATVGGIGYNRIKFSGTIGAGDRSISNGLTKPGNLKNPNVLMFGDAALYTTGAASVTGTGYLVPNGVGMMDRHGSANFIHNGSGNFSWVDGHVSTERMLDGTDAMTGHFEPTYRYFWSDWTPENPTPPED